LVLKLHVPSRCDWVSTHIPFHHFDITVVSRIYLE
jgi:hypothetical protein